MDQQLGLGSAPSRSDPAREYIPDRRLLKDHASLMQWAQWFVHALVTWFALYWATSQSSAGFSADYRLLGLIAIFAFSESARFVGFQRRYVEGLVAIWRVIEVWVLTSIVVTLAVLFSGTLRRFDPTLLLVFFGVGLFGQILAFLLMKKLAGLFKREMGVRIPSIVIGCGPMAERLVTAVNRNSFLPSKVIGVVETTAGAFSKDSLEVPVLGGVENIEAILEAQAIDRVYIALPSDQADRLEGIHRSVKASQTDVIWVPDIFSLELINPSVREIGGLPVISLSESPMISGPKAFLKSVMDASLASLLLIVLAPLFLLIALGIKLTSRGPVFYRQERHGWDGGIFRIWKFRTMFVHDEASGIVQAKSGDRRITKIGRFLRRTSLDELPQLFNVIDGSMSLVGPRPHAVSHNNEFSEKLHAYMARHRVKPGMTGWAQVHGYRGETDTLDKMQNRLECDLYYINRWSLKLDVLILLMTPLALISSNAR